jgi:hypothetical protein
LSPHKLLSFLFFHLEALSEYVENDVDEANPDLLPEVDDDSSENEKGKRLLSTIPTLLQDYFFTAPVIQGTFEINGKEYQVVTDDNGILLPVINSNDLVVMPDASPDKVDVPGM